jgi:hypothetical protein
MILAIADSFPPVPFYSPEPPPENIADTSTIYQFMINIVRMPRRTPSRTRCRHNSRRTPTAPRRRH